VIRRLKHIPLTLALVLAGLLSIAVQSGCAVLTQSQVDEVAAFAKATHHYGTLPGEPIRIYGKVARLDRMLIVSSRNFTDEDARKKAWDEIEKAYQVEPAFREAGSQADQALSVLDTYVSLLSTLTSDEFNVSLDKSATELSESLDKAIKTYNGAFRTPKQKAELKPIGATVAQAVAGAGGIFIRYRQAQLLKQHVREGDPLVATLMGDVQELVLQVVKPHLERLRGRLKDDFTTAAQRAEKLPLATVVTTAEAMENLEKASQLCDAAAGSAKRYAQAHAKLAQALTERRHLKQRIEEIQVLADEIKAAWGLSRQLRQ